MRDSFTCPNCSKKHDIERLELWNVYNSDGEETEYDCTICDANIIITSRVTGWEFDSELNE